MPPFRPKRALRLHGLPALVLILLSGPAGLAGEADHAVVPGFERFFTSPKADAGAGGQLLLGELSCVSCHQMDAARAALIVPRQAPILDGVGARLRRSYLRRFLANPHAAKPGTVMPDVLGGLPAREGAAAAEALAHFLASTGAPKPARPQPRLVGSGRTVYHQVGCVVCHGTRDADANAEKRLATSVPLGDLKAKYTLGGLTAFLANPHQTRPGGRMPKLLTAKEADEVANYLLQGIAYTAGPPNLTYAYYEGSWVQLPDFDGLKPRATGKASGFDLGVARRQNNMALRFEGHLRIDRAGEYRFHLTSDDGSQLFLDGKRVVNNDGIHAPATASGIVKLAKGMHRLVAAVFNAGGGAELNVEIEGQGLGRQSVTGFVFLTPEGNPPVAKKPASGGDDDFSIDPVLVEKGRELFASVGCANCHTLNAGGKQPPARPAAPALAALRPNAGCLAVNPKPGVPRYALSAAQRDALAAAVRSKQPLPRAAPAPRAVIARTMTALNCYACHQRDKVGGPEEPWNAAFETKEREMGDEARIPPPLDGVGTKLRPEYLRKILADGSRDRPYMLTHMPGFGAGTAETLAKAFEAVDTLESVAKPAFAQSLARVKGVGRKLLGVEALGCIKCHTFNKHRAEGVQGMDMTLLTQRVRRDWFHRYLLDPQKFRPGTRMPGSWPNGVSFYPDVFGGNTTRQIEALWVYLSDGAKAQLPLGLKRQSIPLVPVKDAIIYRNFLADVGPRAIGVGYPEKAHLAFDANDLRLAMIWQGAFIDAALHWTDRGSGFAGPLGDNVLHLPAGPGLAVLDKDSDPWPTKAAKELGQKFHGYRLTPDQRPTFLYSYRGVTVEDFPTAVAGKTGPSLRRTLTLKTDQPIAGLYFRAAVGDRIEAAGDGWYRINNEWRMKIDAAAPPVVRQSGGKQELLVPVRFDANQARIVQEIVW